MSMISIPKAAFRRLVGQKTALRAIISARSNRMRQGYKGPDISHPNWLLILIFAAVAIGTGFGFLDTIAGHWKSEVPPDVYSFFRLLTDLGRSENLLIPAALIILVIGGHDWSKLNKASVGLLCQFQMLGLFVFVAIAGSGLSNNLLKVMIGRARPRLFDELGAVAFDPPGLSSGFQSFPSGHSTTAGAMAVIFILLFPRLKWLWIALTGSIAISRIVVGAHYPSDAVAGFFYGASFTWLLALWFANRRLLFRSVSRLIRLPKTGGFSFARLYKVLRMQH